MVNTVKAAWNIKFMPMLISITCHLHLVVVINVYDDLLEETGSCQRQVILEIYNLVLSRQFIPR
jgi:hypothetical protein